MGLPGSLRVAGKLASIVSLFVLMISFLLLLASARLEVLSAVRAYVGAEGRWSRAQKDAAQHLLLYAGSGDEADYRRYLAAIAVPLGDREARLELEKENADRDKASRGFARGRNHPEDIPGMVRLFRRFGHARYMDRAIAIWARADHYIVKLRRYGHELHGDHTARRPNAARVAAIERKAETAAP